MLAKKTRKILSLALVLIMVISMFPMFAMAEEAGNPDRPENSDIENLLPGSKHYEIGGGEVDDNGDIILSKTAVRVDDDMWEVTVEAIINERPIQSRVVEVCFVFDYSWSMEACTFHTHVNKVTHDEHTSECIKTYKCEIVEHVDECYEEEPCTDDTHFDKWEGETDEFGDPVEDLGEYVHNNEDYDCSGTIRGDLDCKNDMHHTDADHVEACASYSCGGFIKHDDGGCTYLIDDGDGGLKDGNAVEKKYRRLAVAQAAVSEMAGGLGNDISVSYVTFAKDAYGPFYDGLNYTPGESNSNSRMGTNIMAGVNLACAEGFAGGTASEKIMVIVTDGLANLAPKGATNYWSGSLSDFDGTVHAVGFLVDDENMAGIAAKKGGLYMTAGNTSALVSSLDAVKDQITAMVIDPMGPNVEYVAGSADNQSSELGELRFANGTLRWIPKVEEIMNQTIKFTYTVKLKDIPANWTTGVHGNVPLNGETYLQYGQLEGETVIGETAQFNVPEAKYEVGTLQVNWKSGSADIKTATGTESVITDFIEEWYQRAEGRTPPAFTKFIDDAQTKLETIEYLGDTYRYTHSTISIDGVEDFYEFNENTNKFEDIEAVTKAHVVTHYYVKLLPGTLTIAKVFSGIDELPEGFKIDVAGPAGFSSQELTIGNAYEGDGTSAHPYTWTIDDGVVFGQYTITENGYPVDGYTCTTTNSKGGTTSATVTLDESGGSVLFTNTYTPDNPFIPIIFPDPSNPIDIPDPSDPLTDIPDPSDPLTDIPDGDDPLTDIPDDLDPLGDAPKTGDGNNIFLLLSIMISCAFGLVIINLPRKKRNEG